MSPILSICIPTYNRSRFLEETLSSVFTSLSRSSVFVEVLVCDNASPDNTQEVLLEFRKRFPALKIFRNPKNIGELNFYTALHHGTGEYLWLLGDDDLLDPKLISEVIHHLEKKPDLVVCNHSIHSADFKIIYRPAFYTRRLPNMIGSRDKMLGAFGTGLSLISASIIRRDLINAVPRADFIYFAQFGLSFFHAICAAMPADARVSFIAEPLLRYRGGNSPISQWETVFIDGVSLALGRLSEYGYSTRAIRKAYGFSVVRYLIPRIVQMKKDRTDTGPLIKRSIPVFGKTWQFRFLAVPLHFLSIRSVQLFRQLLGRGRIS